MTWLRSNRIAAAAVVGSLAVAAATRLSWLDLMEFKYDEATAYRLALHVLGYSEPGVGRFFPTAGLTSSVGVPNPPLFVYLVAAPVAVVRSPLAVTVCIAVANVVAILLVYLLGRRCFSRFVGVSAAALLALSPWGIVFSRKIWAQDLLPLCTTLFALQLHALLARRNTRAPFWLIVVAAAATELHFSAWVLVPVAALALYFARSWVSWRWAGAGVAVAAASYLPFVALHAGRIVHVGHSGPHRYPGLIARFETALRLMVDIVGGGNLRFLIGSGSPLGGPLSVLLGVAATIGLVAAARRRAEPERRLGQLLLLWFALPLVLLTLLPVHSYIHYFVVLLPLPYLGVAHLVERVVRVELGRALVVAAILCCFAAIDVHLFRTVLHDGGAPGDYGVAYKYKADAVEFALHRTPTGRVRLGLDPRFAQGGPLRTYRLLLWNDELDHPPAARGATSRYLVLSRFAVPPQLVRRYARPGRTAVFGPLSVVELASVSALGGRD
jgi:4-amino-4-deoxy-L-arabinose transferase-like glycosyltransferase